MFAVGCIVALFSLVGFACIGIDTVLGKEEENE